MRTLQILLLAFAIITPMCAGQFGLATTFAAGTGQDGNMFDVVAERDIFITGFDLNLAISANEIRIYTVTAGGSFVGMEDSSLGWTINSTTTVASAGEGNPTHVSLRRGIFLGAGDTLGFYITVTNTFGTGMRYTVSNDFGGVAAQDASLTILQGIAKEYPFAMTFGSTTPGGSSRIWNGRIHYKVVDDVATFFIGGNSQDGVMFDVSTTENIALQSLELNLQAGSHGISVYTVTSGGTFVGHETTSADWTFIGNTGVTSAGPGSPTTIPLVLDFEMSAGETRGFYLTTLPAGAPLMEYTNGSNFGGPAASDGTLTIHEGVGSAFPFAGIFGSTTPGGSSRIVNGRIRYSLQPLRFAFTENFDGVPGGATTTPPAGWMQDLNDATPPTSNSDWLFRSDQPGSLNGPLADHTNPGIGNFAYIEDSAGGDHAAISLLSRPIDISLLIFGGHPTLSFWVNSNDAGAAQNPLAVDVLEYPLGEENRDVLLQVGSTMGTWTQFTVCLTPYDGPVIQLRFRGRNDNGTFMNDVGLDDVAVGFTLGGIGSGQPPQFGLATLDINSAGDPSRCVPVSSGLPGPYRAVAHAGGTMDISMTSEPSVPLLFFVGPTNPNLLDLGAIGKLDVGNPGLTNIVLIGDGNATDFFNSLFRTASDGTLELALPTPSLLLGLSLGFQAISFNSSPSAISLSNAVDVTFIP